MKHLNLQLDDYLHAELVAAARKANRSLQGEILWRLRLPVEDARGSTSATIPAPSAVVAVTPPPPPPSLPPLSGSRGSQPRPTSQTCSRRGLHHLDLDAPCPECGNERPLGDAPSLSPSA
jgi:hypothetical protein